VAHGGVWSFLLGVPGHPCVRASPSVAARFHNCELRSCRLTLHNPGEAHSSTSEGHDNLGAHCPVFQIEALDEDWQEQLEQGGVAAESTK
jgi:hypothetical protein